MNYIRYINNPYPNIKRGVGEGKESVGRKEGEGKGKGGRREGGTCSKVLGGDRRPCQLLKFRDISKRFWSYGDLNWKCSKIQIYKNFPRPLKSSRS